MASIRCGGGVFVFAIFFILLHFLAYSLQDTEKRVSVSVAGDRFEERTTTMLSRQEKDALKAVPTRVDVMMNGKRIGGRKTMKMVNEQRINGEEMASKKTTSSSANPRNGGGKVPKPSSSSSNPRNGDHKMPKKKQNKTYHHDHDHDHDHHVEVRMKSAFMALNADYHVPRSHPPRNN
ncbi:lateral signaling target protein 2 homolog [Cynara cardunculus var. scolymus]|uniref:lateral signaling target protein 2 homolog n=1 Tax=Cynara cardunculus var. scolymus TaxID=59895 RepID=UPI000D62D020|nr:lateral signaling target protein 2 homolog [Cynara cardunculus var. scolymus]